MFYHIKTEQVPLAKRIARSGLVFALTLLGALVIHRSWFAQSAWNSWEKLFDALTAAGAFFVFESRRREYEIEVTDEAISMRGGLWLGAHKVRRGRIHFLRELGGNFFREPALRLSERGPIGRFLFGFVSVPKSMPQYEEIRSKAMSWIGMS